MRFFTVLVTMWLSVVARWSLRFVAVALALTGMAADGFAGTPATQRANLDPSLAAAIEVTPVSDRWNGSGFMPVRVRIENRSSDPLSWGFDFEVSRGWGSSTLNYKARVGAEPGAVVETVLMVPGSTDYSTGARVQQTSLALRLDGPGSPGYVAGFSQNSRDMMIPTATTPGLESKVFSAVYGAPGTQTEVVAVQPSLWPADWRVWSPFARVVLDETAYAELDGARRAALLDWVAMGGTLDIYPSRGGVHAEERRHGHGVIRRMEIGLVEQANLAIKPEVKLGRVEMGDLQRGAAVQVSPERMEALKPKRDVLWVSIFLVGFGLLVGPVNLFWFARSGRRQRLFFTVPAISLGASILLAGFIVMEDGFDGEGAMHGVVFLLPDTNQAVVTQFQFSRTGVLLGGGFELSDDVLMAHTGGTNIQDNSDYHRSSDYRSARYLRGDGRAGGDWFASRRLQFHELRRLVPTRARVELVGGDAGGAPVVQSSLGAVMKTFRYLDAKGVLWEAPELAPGQRVTLRRSEIESDAVTEEPEWRRGMFTASAGAAEGLAPIATLDAIRWDAPEFLYTGQVVGSRTP